MRCLIVIPTREESENLPFLLPKVRESVPDADILIVDDLSLDGTADVARSIAAQLGRIHVLERSGPKGLGPAYAAGFAWGLDRGYDIFAGMDADLSHDPISLPALLALVENGADVAVGSRYVTGGCIDNWPAHRRLLSRWGNRYAAAALGLPIADVTSGFRTFSAPTIKTIVGSTTRASGYGFLVEQLYRMNRSGAVIREAPISFIDRVRGASKMNVRIIVEAMLLVTMWGIRDRVRSALLRDGHPPRPR